MKKEKKSLIGSGFGQTSDKYKNLSLSEFRELLDKDNQNNCDEDLELIIDLLICLVESNNICKVIGIKNELYVYHVSRIKHLNEILKEFTWFNELKKENKNFSFSL